MRQVYSATPSPPLPHFSDQDGGGRASKDMPSSEIDEARATIAYLEAKVEFLKQHCIELLEGPSTTGATADLSVLSDCLDAERQRVSQLNKELMEVKAHRDDIEHQIKHQHQHVLYLTEKIHNLEAQLLSTRRSSSVIRVVEWLQHWIGRKSAATDQLRAGTQLPQISALERTS